MSGKVTVRSTLSSYFANARKTLGPELAKAMETSAEHVKDELEAETGRFASRRSRVKHLKDSFKIKLWKSQIKAQIYSTKPYARIQDQGGTIRPKGHEYLAIPLTPTADRRKPRNFPGLSFIQKDPHLPVLAKISPKGKISPQYVLVHEAKISGRHFIDNVLSRTTSRVGNNVHEAFKRALKL